MVAKAEAKEWARAHVTGLWGVHWVPFDEDDDIDEAQLRDHVERVLRQPMAGLSVAGMLDELFYVSIPERKRIAELVAEVARGRLPMYCSATTDSIRDTLDLIQHAHELGYDMAMVWPSPEHARSDKILYEFYAYLDRHSPMAISAYSTPHSGRLMSPEVAGAAVVHTGTVIVPAVMAAAERAGSRGADVVAAIVAGYEVFIRVGWALAHVPGTPDDTVQAQSLHRGWYPPAVLGGFGVVAALGNLRGQSAERILHAMGTFANIAPTTMLASFRQGVMAKGLGCGMASASGIMCAELADAGFTGGSGRCADVVPVAGG